MTQNNDWIQIKIRTTNSFSDAVAELLEQLGALAVSYTDAEDSPIFIANSVVKSSPTIPLIPSVPNNFPIIFSSS